MVESVKEREILNTKSEIRNKFKIQNSKPIKLSEVKHIEKGRLKSGYEEFDRVVGGGIVPGSATLLSGDPGIGKSTLLLHIISKIGGLYISGEESAEQVKLRAKRLGIKGENIVIMPETDVDVIIKSIKQEDSMTIRPKTGSYSNASFKVLSSYNLVVIDSVQTLSSGELAGMPGSVGQVRYCAERLTQLAKNLGIPVVIIGHVTKEGTIAGPKVLEHMVDTVLYLEGERFAQARILRTLKNRFGAIEEVGIFEMKDSGLIQIDNPSAVFLKDRVKNVPGSAVTVVMEGTRPLLVEIQALVVPSQLAIPRRIANGIDFNRLQLIGAILTKRLNMPLGSFDIFINVSGGLRITEPSADLAVAIAIISSFKNKAIEANTAIFGELGLLGEIRSPNASERRIKEAKRLGFKTIIAQPQVKNLKQASTLLG
ncbi:DNA repair protein RadA [Patescibacteria group bacterium]